MEYPYWLQHKFNGNISWFYNSTLLTITSVSITGQLIAWAAGADIARQYVCTCLITSRCTFITLINIRYCMLKREDKSIPFHLLQYQNATERVCIHNRQRTPASWLCPQLCTPIPRWEQSISLFSFPVQLTSSIKILPVPPVKALVVVAPVSVHVNTENHNVGFVSLVFWLICY